MNEKNKSKGAIIFDFDGTIADAVPILREVYDEIAEKRGYPVMDEETYMRLRKGSVKDVIKWVGVKPWQLAGVMKEGRKLFAQKVKLLNLFDGAAELIKDLHKKGWDIYVLSSNSEQTIKLVLGRYQIEDRVKVLRRPPLFGKSKSIKKLLKTKKYTKKSVWMIGDEIRDVEAGKKAGVNTVSVTWGVQDASALKAMKPDHLVNKISEIKRIFN